MPFRPIILAAMMVVVLGYLGFLSHMTDVQVEEQIAAMRADAVKSAHRNITYDLGVNVRYGALVAGYEVGWGGGEPEEIEPRVVDFLNERISRGFDYRVVEVTMPRVSDGACEIEFSEDGSYSVDLALDGSVTHVAGGVRASGFEVGEELSPRWKLLYDLVHAEHPKVLLTAATALAYNEDVQAALDAWEAELNAQYSDEGVVWELRWDGSEVETIARDARTGPIVPVDGKLGLMPYRLTTGEAGLPEVEVPEPEPKPTPAPAPRPRPEPPREPHPDFTISIWPSLRVLYQGEGRPASYTVTLTSLDGYSGMISLSVSGLPSRSSAILDPAVLELQANESASSTLRVSTRGTPPFTPLGSYTLTITGRGSLTRSASARLYIQIPHSDFPIIAHDRYSLPNPGGGWYYVTVQGVGVFFDISDEELAVIIHRAWIEQQPIADTGPWLD